jgi:transcriptional regulator of acetoin/glycerol metabolism
MEPPTDEEQLEEDLRELRDSHETLGQLIASTRTTAERRRRAMIRMKKRHGWDNTRVAAAIGVEKGTVWKAVRTMLTDKEDGDAAIAS